MIRRDAGCTRERAMLLRALAVYAAYHAQVAVRTGSLRAAEATGALPAMLWEVREGTLPWSRRCARLGAGSAGSSQDCRFRFLVLLLRCAANRALKS